MVPSPPPEPRSVHPDELEDDPPEHSRQRGARIKTLLAFASLAVVAAVAAVAIVALRAAIETTGTVSHSNEVRAASEGVGRSLLETQAAQRAFLVSNDAAYLARREAAASELGQQLAAVHERAAPDAAIDHDILELDRSVSAAMAALDEALERSGDEPSDDPELGGRRSGDGLALEQQMIDDARLVLGRIQRSDTARLSSQKSMLQEQIGRARGVLAIGGVVALGCAALAIASLRRDASEREHNVAELHRANRRLRQANESLDREIREGELVRRDNERVIADLARSNRELDQFAYVTSHDLKAPLRGIASLAAWIEEDAAKVLSDESREHLRLMQIRVARMDALIEGLLEYSRAGRADAPLENVDVEELVYEIVEIATLPDDAQVAVDSSLPVLVTHRVPLQLVLTNLLVNAAKHGRGATGLRIRVSAQREASAWVFTVADQGPGIEARYHARIFGLFQTLAPRDKVEGTGIGLAVVSKTVQARGGWVEVDSDLGDGARFRFSWPDHLEAMDESTATSERVYHHAPASPA